MAMAKPQRPLELGMKLWQPNNWFNYYAYWSSPCFSGPFDLIWNYHNRTTDIIITLNGQGHASAARGTWYENITTEQLI